MNKQEKFFVKAVSGFLAVMLVLALPACSSAPSEMKTVPGPDGYTFIMEPEENQIVGFSPYESDYIADDLKTLAKNATLIVVGKFLGNTDSYIEKDLTIYTKGLFKVEDVLKGSYKESYLEAIYSGGIIPLNQYMAELTKDQIEYYNFDKMSEAKRKQCYIEDRSDIGAEPEKDVTYILLLTESEKGYVVQVEKYGMVPMKDGKVYDYFSETYKDFSEKTFSFTD